MSWVLWTQKLIDVVELYLGFYQKTCQRDGVIVKDLFLFVFFENGNVLCEQIEMGKKFARDTYIAAVSSQRDIGWYATGPWAPSPQMFKPPSNLSTPLEQTRTRGDLRSVRLEPILMKLLLGTCWIALKSCGSRSYFLGAVERLFLLSESWLCLWVWEFVTSRPKVLLCSYDMRHWLSLFYPVAFRELVFCFVSIQVELSSLQSPMLGHWQIWNKLNFHWTVKGA